MSWWGSLEVKVYLFFLIITAFFFFFGLAVWIQGDSADHSFLSSMKDCDGTGLQVVPKVDSAYLPKERVWTHCNSMLRQQGGGCPLEL